MQVGQFRANVLRRVLGRVIGIAIFAAIAGASLPAAAAPDPKHRAEAPYKEGVDLAKAGKTEAALAKFEEAYSYAPTGAAAYQIARMEQALGRHALALQHYREALRDSSLATDLRRDAEKGIEDLKTKVGVVTLDVPPGAATTVDGNDVDPKNALELVPGLHVVKIRLGTEAKSVDVDAQAGVVTPVKVRFEEAATPAPSPAATHTSEPPPVVKESPSWTTGHFITVSVLGLGAVALGVVSIVFDGKAGDAVDEAKTLPPTSCASATSADCTRASSLKDDHDSDRSISTITLIGGVVLAGGAVGAAVFWPKSEKASARIVPAAAPGYGGVNIVGRF